MINGWHVVHLGGADAPLTEEEVVQIFLWSWEGIVDVREHRGGCFTAEFGVSGE